MMYEPKYKVSFRVTHPSVDVDTIGMALNLSPKISYKAGDKKVTPKGTEIDGVRKNSFWCYELPDSDESLEDTLVDFNSLLEEKQLFLKSLLDSGGTLEYFVGWFQVGNSGFVLDVELIRKLADIGIQLSFDTYD